MSADKVEKLIKDNKVEFVDLRFADVRGIQHHVTFPANIVDESLFEDGRMFDGSSISGWKGINESDMVLLPDASTAYLDPFTADPTVVLTCDVLEGHLSSALPHLANISYRVGRELKFDPKNETITGDKEASALLTRTYRKGFELPNVGGGPGTSNNNE